MATTTTETTQTITEGTRVVSVRMVPGGKGYHAPGIYEARKRASDGKMTFRLVSSPLGTFYFQGREMFIGRRSRAKALREAEAIADRLGVAVDPDVRHGSPAV